MNSTIIKNAAITARLLGYGIKTYLPEGLEFGFISVMAPKDIEEVVYFRVDPEHPPLQNYQMLGHWKVRLHMEKYYGIATPHYWENVNITQEKEKTCR